MRFHATTFAGLDLDLTVNQGWDLADDLGAILARRPAPTSRPPASPVTASRPPVPHPAIVPAERRAAVAPKGRGAGGFAHRRRDRGPRTRRRRVGIAARARAWKGVAAVGGGALDDMRRAFAPDVVNAGDGEWTLMAPEEPTDRELPGRCLLRWARTGLASTALVSTTLVTGANVSDSPWGGRSFQSACSPGS